MSEELKTVLEKLDKSEKLTQEELDLLKKLDAKKGDPVVPARKLDLSDAPTRAIRSITEIMAKPARELNEEEVLIQSHMDDMVLLGTLLKKNPRTLKHWDYPFAGSTALRKALDTATAAEGQEWVPTLMSANLIELFRLGSSVASLFPDIPMPSNPYDIPYFGAAAQFYYVGESTSDEPSKASPTTPGTGKQTLTAKKFKARTLFSDELSEDSIVPVLPALRSELVTAGAEALEDAIINGDVTATHMDADVVDSRDVRKIWKGLRMHTVTTTDRVDLGTFATTTLITIRTKMKKFGIDPKALCWIVSPQTYNKMMALTEVLTVDKFGPLAVLINGELARLHGIPIIISGKVREDLANTGYYTVAGQTTSLALLVNRNGFMLGSRGQVKVTFKEDAEVDQNQLIMSFRKAFSPRWTTSSTILTVGLAYNVTA